MDGLGDEFGLEVMWRSFARSLDMAVIELNLDASSQNMTKEL